MIAAVPSSPLKICIDARLVSGSSGGVETVVTGLASGLSALVDGDEQYLFVGWEGDVDYLRPHVKDAARIVTGGRPSNALGRVPRLLREPLRRIEERLALLPVKVPRSDGTIERLGADLVHFPLQSAFLTEVPSIYHPHDLQHLHLPQFFSRRQRIRREVQYRRFCEQAAMVAILTTWGRNDVISHYGLAPEKVVCVPLAPHAATLTPATTAEREATRAKFGLPADFLFYPAQTWPHKNHVALLEAAASLRGRGHAISLVFSGTRTDHASVLDARAKALGLDGRVFFTGFTSDRELVALYGLARAVVIPTLFEAASAPLWEAFQLGTAAACSNVTSLPRQAGDAALVFDPRRPDDVAAAMERLWTEPETRASLIERGHRNVARLSWERTASHFRAHYRRLSGRPLTDQDRALLAMEPIF